MIKFLQIWVSHFHSLTREYSSEVDLLIPLFVATLDESLGKFYEKLLRIENIFLQQWLFFMNKCTKKYPSKRNKFQVHVNYKPHL